MSVPAQPSCEVVPAVGGMKPRGATHFLVWVTGASGGIPQPAYPALNCPTLP